MIKIDNIHYDFREVDSYDKDFNFIISSRGSAKTSRLWRKVYLKWKHHHRPSIAIRYRTIDITEAYIDSIETTINDFLPDNRHIKFEYKRGQMKDGIVDIKVNGKDFIRVLSMNQPITRLKSLIYDDPAYMVWDEYILDNRTETRVSELANKFQSCYQTFNRHALKHGHKMKCYFCGNLYSLYHELHVWLNIPLEKIKPGCLLIGDTWLLQFYKLKPELIKWLEENDPLYKMDTTYKKFALDSIPINDTNFAIVNVQPQGFKLKYIFRISHKYLAIYHKPMNRYKEGKKPGYDCGKYWVATLDNYEGSKKIFSVDFDNLVEGTQLATADIRSIMWKFKDAVASRDVTYQSVECGYLTEAIYSIC